MLLISKLTVPFLMQNRKENVRKKGNQLLLKHKKVSIITKNMGKTKQWKKNGEQDKFILKLMRNGKINKDTKPVTLQKDHPALFGDFSTNVIRNHLNMLKMSYGIFLRGESDEEDEVYEDKEVQKNEAVDFQLESSSGPGCITNIHHNYPVLCDMYKDPDNQFENVVLAVLLPSGIRNVRVELNNDGMAAIVKYVWPATMFNIEDLYKKSLSNNEINIFHPKVLCFKNALEKVRARVDASPEGVINVNLPIKVQTASDSWTKGGIKRDDGTHIAFAEFKGYIKDYNKKVEESHLIFHM
ncbi:hypothetical protein Bhyg_13151 [Pseudolycoriella hygida]|uniref:Uncharacterized protein n=1 Tax=Pseudolycoriella hygida TaxID=35572 RepID=A0A9Q0MMF0_9DIPT|nr:hypothetical protein Bhyg_13151 [Pseudolycoriella hygida]